MNPADLNHEPAKYVYAFVVAAFAAWIYYGRRKDRQ